MQMNCNIRANKLRDKKLKKVLTFINGFDMIYLAAENGGKIFLKTSIECQ